MAVVDTLQEEEPVVAVRELVDKGFRVEQKAGTEVRFMELPAAVLVQEETTRLEHRLLEGAELPLQLLVLRYLEPEVALVDPRGQWRGVEMLAIRESPLRAAAAAAVAAQRPEVLESLF